MKSFSISLLLSNIQAFCLGINIKNRKFNYKFNSPQEDAIENLYIWLTLLVFLNFYIGMQKLLKFMVG